MQIEHRVRAESQAVCMDLKGYVDSLLERTVRTRYTEHNVMIAKVLGFASRGVEGGPVDPGVAALAAADFVTSGGDDGYPFEFPFSEIRDFLRSMCLGRLITAGEVLERLAHGLSELWPLVVLAWDGINRVNRGAEWDVWERGVGWAFGDDGWQRKKRSFGERRWGAMWC
jgi:hypothetical protein